MELGGIRRTKRRNEPALLVNKEVNGDKSIVVIGMRAAGKSTLEQVDRRLHWVLSSQDLDTVFEQNPWRHP